jgi:anthranilate synthase component I
LIHLLEPDVDLLALHRRDPRRYPCLLESVTRGGPQAHHDLLFVADGARLTLNADGRVEGRGHHPAAERFLDALDAWWHALRCVQDDSPDLPFHGGWCLYLGYELAAEIEPRLALARPRGQPVAAALRCPAALVRDHATGRVRLVAEPGQDALVERVRADLERSRALPASSPPLLAAPLAEDPPAAFLDGVRHIRDYITDGDVFQVNLSRAWRGRLAAGVESAAIYARLRESNPAPFAALARIDDLAIISSSPERLVSARAGLVETRPIAGTRPRGADPAADRLLSDRLLAHPKERAEHIMLIDLERNDLGRICVPGTVTVNELMTLESYAHVHHIVSNVRGRLRDGVSPGAIVRAVFPGGTITGCPKVRCMEIIAELEGGARGPYTGSLGYLGRDGSLDLNILIRSLERHGDALTLRAGAGIVADSAPDKELEETRSKARGLTRAFEY